MPSWPNVDTRLSYPITETYPWRHFTAITAGASFFVLVVITLVNVVAAGYETVTVTRQDYNFTPRYWWSPFAVSQAPVCQAHQFLFGDTFYTNLSVFQYTLMQLTETAQSGQSQQAWGFSYSGKLLNTTCLDPDLQPTYSLTIDRPQKSVQATVAFDCVDIGQSAPHIVLQAMWSISASSYWTITPVEASTNSTAMYFVDSVLMALAGDLLVGIVSASANSSSPIDTIYAQAFVSCNDYNQTLQCPNTPLNVTQFPLQLSYSNDTILMLSEVPDVLSQSINNFFQALNAAFLADIGAWYPNNMFISAEMLNATIMQNEAVDAAIARNPSFGALEYNVSNAGAMTSGASMIRSQNGTAAIDPSAAVFALNYLCQVQQMKSPLNFIVSVLVADASMFAAFYALWTSVASMLARRRSRKGESNQDASFILMQDVEGLADLESDTPLVSTVFGDERRREDEQEYRQSGTDNVKE